jgi:hypothetical protein
VPRKAGFFTDPKVPRNPDEELRQFARLFHSTGVRREGPGRKGETT